MGQLEGSYRDFQSNCWVNLLSLGHPCEFYLQLAASSCKPLALPYDRHADRSARSSGAGRSFSALTHPGFRFMETPDHQKVAPWAALAVRRFAATLQASHGRPRHFLAGCPFSSGALCYKRRAGCRENDLTARGFRSMSFCFPLAFAFDLPCACAGEFAHSCSSSCSSACARSASMYPNI